jgi:hypothetical protein
VKTINLNINTKIYTCSSVGIDYFFFLGKTIRNSGYQVEDVYLISEQDYRRQAKSKGVEKLLLRYKMYVLYPLNLIKKVWSAKGPTIFIVSSNTFYAPLIVKAFSSKETKVVNLVYDLFPDAIEVANKISPNSNISKFIGKITSRIFNRSDANVFLGEALKKFALNRWAPSNTKLNKAIDISADYSLFEKEFFPPKQNSKLTFHYGGQLGHLHDADGLVSLIKLVNSNYNKEKYSFEFNLSGANADYLELECKPYNININAAVTSEIWRKKILDYQIGLVSLSPGGATVCLPSKTYAMMGGGLAIIAICPIWSDLARLIVDMDAGWVINNSYYTILEEIPIEDFNTQINKLKSSEEIESEMQNLIELIFSDNDLVLKKRQNAFRNVRKYHGEEILTNSWKNLLESLQ